MKVSIITIVFNNKHCISDCIQSVLDQSYDNIEHIVVDGGSSDGTQDIIENYKDKLGYYISEKDEGLYNALNKGLKQCTGEVIGILHSDDTFYDSDTIKKVANTFLDTNSDLVYAKGLYVDKNNTESVKRIYPSKIYKKRYLNFGWIPLHTTIYIKKELLDKYGYYNEKYSIASDYDISLRWFKEDSIRKYYLDQWVVKMRLGGKSTTASLQKKKSSEDYRIIKEHNLLGIITLGNKILRKIPQYLIPRLLKNK